MAIVGWPVFETRARKDGARPSAASACSTRGPPSTLPKAEDRMAPQSPGKTSQAPKTATLVQITPGIASSSGVTFPLIARKIGTTR